MGWVEKIVGKRKQSWSSAFSLFPTMFSKAFIFRVVKSQHCVVKGERVYVIQLKSSYNHGSIKSIFLFVQVNEE